MMLFLLGVWLGGMVPIVIELVAWHREDGPFDSSEYPYIIIFTILWPFTIWLKD